MTPQEALAQALELAACKARPGEPCSDPENHHAAAILDALPEGWAVDNVEESVACETDAYIRGFKVGAQQERERLRAAHTPTVDRDGDPACTCGWEAYPRHFDAWWDHVAALADPEDDR